MKRSFGSIGALVVSAVMSACSSSSSTSGAPTPPALDAGNIDSSVPPNDSASANDSGTGDAIACGLGAAVPTDYKRAGGDSVQFPAGFLFGAASAGFQIEKGLHATDWYNFTLKPGQIQNGDNPDNGPDGLAHIAGDVKALQDAGANAYRFSIEWARIFPTKDAFINKQPDATAVATYHSELSALKAAGIRPFVTLHHFATPDYLDDITQPTQPQTFERDEMPTMMYEWAKWAGGEFGGEVDDWVTINEPLGLILGAYVAAGHPPGVTNDINRALGAAKRLVLAHVQAYKGLKDGDQVVAFPSETGSPLAARVSIAAHNRVFYPADPCTPGDVTAAKTVDYLWNEWMYNAIVFGNWDDDFDGKYDGPNDKQGDPTLKGTVDYLGLNYYGNALVSSLLPLPVIGGVPTYALLPTTIPKTDLDWDIFPQGFRVVLRQLKKYNLPIYILENGIADSADKNRARYMAEHVWEVGRAIAEDGVDVRGYFWWSLIDNFEWDSGFCPRFGMYRVDYSSPDRVRASTSAVTLFKGMATSGKLAATTVDGLPSYSPPVRCGAR